GADGVRVEPLADGAEADVTIDVGALSAAYLGAVRLETLQAAGRVTGSADKIRALSDALRARAFPHLSIVY
ncbi:MAG: sterol carrier protein domain-containing protein, partial [Microbacterium gubbeenense]